MAAFKKSDSNQVEMAMAVIISVMLILIPVFFMLMWFGYITEGDMSSAEYLLTFGGGFLLIFVIMYLMKPENRYLCVLDVLLLLEALSFILSTVFAKNVETAVTGNTFSLEGTFINLAYLVLIFCCSNLKNKKHRMCVYMALIAVAVFECFMGFMQTVVKYEPLVDASAVADMEYRAYGTFTNQNPYGAFMAMFAALEFGLLITSKKKLSTVLHGLLAIACAVCVMLSGTRGAMVGLGFAVILYGIIVLVGVCKKKEYAKNVGKKYLIAVIAAVIAVGIACILSADAVKGVIQRVIDDFTTTNLDSLGSGRIYIWKKVLAEWSDNNVITGLGVANLRLIYFEGSAFNMVFVAHNEYIDILANRGIIGILTYLALMIYIFVIAMRRLFKNGISGSKELFGLLLAFVTYMVTAFFGWRIIYLTPYFYVLIGLMIPRDESKKLKLKKKWKRK